MDDHGFAPPQPADHRAWIWVLSILGPIYSFLSFGTRLLCKSGRLGYDDLVLAMANLLAIAHWATLYGALLAGLGTSAQSGCEARRMPEASVLYFVARLCLLGAVNLSELSTLLLSYLTFLPMGIRRTFQLCCTALLTVTLLTTLLSSLGCNPAKITGGHTTIACAVNALRWNLLTVAYVATEIMVVAAPIICVWKIKITAVQKGIVAAGFAFRLIAAAAGTIATVSYIRFLHGGEPSVGLVPTLAWQEMWLAIALVTASTPFSRPFLQAFMSRHGYTQFGLQSMRPCSISHTLADQPSIPLQDFPFGGSQRSGGLGNASNVDTGKVQRIGRALNDADGESVRSAESQQRIIQGFEFWPSSETVSSQ